MASSGGMTKTDIIDGIGEITFNSGLSFFEYLHERMLNHPDYIWRGQRVASWGLDSTLKRLMNQNEGEVVSFSFYKEHLDRFKQASRGRRGSNPTKLEDDNDWWALGQHHGLATPLLDWTTSPYVAAYFAFNEIGDDQSKYRSVYALHQSSVETKVNINLVVTIQLAEYYSIFPE